MSMVRRAIPISTVRRAILVSTVRRRKTAKDFRAVSCTNFISLLILKVSAAGSLASTTVRL